MISNLIVTDKEMVKEGKPIKEAQVYADHVKVHPDFVNKIKEGLEKMFGEKCRVISNEEYLSGTFGRN